MNAFRTRTCESLELQSVSELAARVGGDPLLTQASTGNCSIKLGDILWIKASGKWMANAAHDDIFTRLHLGDVMECLRHDCDVNERFPAASLETAMHALMRQRVILHVHCVNTIAWAVRADAVNQLHQRLDGLRWNWIPYVASGVPLGREIEYAQTGCPGTNVFVLGNHGLVLGGDDAAEVTHLLTEVVRRLNITPRAAHPADYSFLAELCDSSSWALPDDDNVHALATDPASQSLLADGLLYPCQAIFTDAASPDVYRAIPAHDARDSNYRDRPFLLIAGRGVVLNKSARAAGIAMISGLTNVVQRLSASSPIRYLTQTDLAGLSGQIISRYRERANVSH